MDKPADKPAAPEILALDYPAFLAAYRNGEVIVNFERKAAGRFLSARMLLPLFMLPVLGIGVSLALVGWLWSGLAVIALAMLLPRIVKGGAPHFLMQQLLEDEGLYRELVAGNVIELVKRN
ncbi:MAG: hypothetical protein ACK59Y_13145 [Betaproteobacteria bacterium]|jgi:hypothetical protein|nr:hypothetical protein [Betaproteobacteria bacterium]